MQIRTQIFLTIAMIAIGAALLLNIAHFFEGGVAKLISQGEVRGVAVVVDSIPYTLSYDQQKELISHFNQAIPLGAKEDITQGAKPDFDKIVIYRFEKEDINVSPVVYLENNLVFSCRQWHEGRMFKDTSQGAMKELLQSAHDKVIEQKEHTPALPKIE